MKTKTSYYGDQVLLAFLFRSERKLRNLFSVCLVCSIMCFTFFGWAVLTGDDISPVVLIVASLVDVLCLLGLWYCYRSSRKERLRFKRMLQQEREEINSLVDELERERQRKNENI